MRPSTRVAYSSLAEHPQLGAVEAVLSRVPVLTDGELTSLASRWSNPAGVSRARDAALSPDTVLVVDVLRAFDDLPHLYADDLDGTAAYCVLEPAVVTVALKAVRDAIAATIARPQLSRREARLLLAPWEASVTGAAPGASGGARGDVDRLARAAASLAERCHDPRRAEAFDRVLLGAMTRDRESAEEALRTAFAIAVDSTRRRSWTLVRERIEQSLVAATCHRCPSSGFDGYERERVALLCADAACGLLVADRLDGRRLDVLLEPLAGLVPFPRPPLGA